MVRAILISGLAGLVFGIGLQISGMTDPSVILGFLDLFAISTGNWNPSLAFVLVGGLGAAAPLFAWARQRPRPMIEPVFQHPTSKGIDWRLILGSALFGAGWALVGYCPGPALAALSAGLAEPVLFVASMALGMTFYRLAFEPAS